MFEIAIDNDRNVELFTDALQMLILEAISLIMLIRQLSRLNSLLDFAATFYTLINKRHHNRCTGHPEFAVKPRGILL